MLNSFNSWYSLLPCEYPIGTYRLTQHTHCPDSDAFAGLGVSSTYVAEGDYKALLNIAQSNNLDVWGLDGVISMFDGSINQEFSGVL